jgi:methylated-DNA-[protein]-cysteine S-methyltransferase
LTELFTTYYRSPVGVLRIAGTEHYISVIGFEDEDQAHNRKPSEGAPPPLLIQAIEELIQYFNGERRHFEFPIHQRGTDFQEKVWNELLNIRYGRTVSYLELSRRLGDTKSIRAAASANGKNNLAIVVPCHRVIGSKNDLVGYGGGLWRKKWLLDHENRIANGVQTLF